MNHPGLLGQITSYRLAHIQLKECLNITLLLFTKTRLSTKHYKTSFIPNALDLFHRFNFSFKVSDSFQNNIEGGSVLIRDALGSHFVPFRNQIARLGLIYLDQITTPDGLFLDSWQDLHHKTFTQTTNIPNFVPAWFKKLRSIVLSEDPAERSLIHYAQNFSLRHLISKTI